MTVGKLIRELERLDKDFKVAIASELDEATALVGEVRVAETADKSPGDRGDSIYFKHDIPENEPIVFIIG